MANLTSKTATTAISSGDLLYVVIDPATTPADKKLAISDLFKSWRGNFSNRSYASLSAAITAIGSSQATLEIPVSTTVTASLTIPANVTLRFTGAGVVSVNVSQTLTINGPIETPLRQIFTGTGVVRLGGNIPIAYPQWWGAVMDGATDDQAAIQKALDSFTGAGSGTFRAGIVEITGGAAIGSTLTFSLPSVVLRGTGWGITDEPQKRGFLKWIGSAGSPMILFVDVLGCGIENIRLVGKTTAKPSAAIEMRQTGGSLTQDQTSIKNVYIGAYFSTDVDTGVQFTVGILFTGSVNSDFNECKNITIQKCVTGVDVQNPNASATDWDGLTVYGCDVGFKTVALHTGRRWLFASNLVDLSVGGNNGKLVIDHFVSEGSGRLAVMTADRADIHIRTGSFQCFAANFTPADSGNNRWLIDAAVDNAGTSIRLEDFEVSYEGGITIVPVIRQKAASGGQTSVSSLRLINVSGITAKNIDVGSAVFSTDSSRYIEFSRRSLNSAVTPIDSRVHLNYQSSGNGSFQDTRFDVLGKLNSFGGPLNVERLPTTGGASATAVGGTGTTYGYRLSALSLDGETLAIATFTCSGGAVLSSTVYNLIEWHPVIGAYAYKIYGRTSGSELLLTTVLAQDLGDTVLGGWRDTGAFTPSGALPAVNSTGNAKVAGTLTVGSFTSTERDALTAVNGMIIYNSTTSKLQVRAGGLWVDLH